MKLRVSLVPSSNCSTESQWQHGIVERHGAVMGDIITAVVMETRARGSIHLQDLCLHASMAKHRRPGKTGYSPRALVFGVDEKLMLSGLTHYLEEPDDAALANANQDAEIQKTF